MPGNWAVAAESKLSTQLFTVVSVAGFWREDWFLEPTWPLVRSR